MIWLWLALLLSAGMGLSAFFSGSETGFYRATRVRLMLDGRDGRPFARGLLWLTNNPSLFVATTLVGNNLANYATSLAIVLAAEQAPLGPPVIALELIAPIAAAPFVFVYGELLPKMLFFQAPNRLLRLCGPLFLVFAGLFFPVAALLWLLGRLLGRLLGESPEQVQSKLARGELARLFEEGHETGLLLPSQRALAQSLFSHAANPIASYMLPVARVASARRGGMKAAALALARRRAVSELPIGETGGQPEGYVRVVDLYLDDSKTIDNIRPLLEIPQHASHSAALLRLTTSREPLAKVVDPAGKTIGLVFLNRLIEPLFR